MHRTQIQLPDDLYQRVRRYSECREMSLAETVRRALELLLQQSSVDITAANWKLPVLDLGLKVPIEDLKMLMDADEDERLLQKVGFKPRDEGWG